MGSAWCAWCGQPIDRGPCSHCNNGQPWAKTVAEHIAEAAADEVLCEAAETVTAATES